MSCASSGRAATIEIVTTSSSGVAVTGRIVVGFWRQHTSARRFGTASAASLWSRPEPEKAAEVDGASRSLEEGCARMQEASTAFDEQTVLSPQKAASSQHLSHLLQ